MWAWMSKWLRREPRSHDYPRPAEAQLQALPFLPALEVAAPPETPQLETNTYEFIFSFVFDNREKKGKAP